jgi:hypothetical protein
MDEATYNEKRGPFSQTRLIRLIRVQASKALRRVTVDAARWGVIDDS